VQLPHLAASEGNLENPAVGRIGERLTFSSRLELAFPESAGQSARNPPTSGIDDKTMGANLALINTTTCS
jgi:hypothetical protein